MTVGRRGHGGRRGRVRARATDLLAPLRIGAYRRLWSADVISSLGDWAGRLALAVLVYERTGSPAWAAAVTAVSLAGFVGLGQVLATFGDRHGRVSVMLVTDVARAACFLAMLLPIPVGGLLVLAFLAGLASPPFEAARAAALPDLVPEARYGDALALSGITAQTSLVGGYAVGGALLFVISPTMALAVNAATFLVSAAILVPLRRTPAAAPAAEQATVGASLGKAARVLFGDRFIRRAVVLVGVTGCLGTVSEALVVPYAGSVGFAAGHTGFLAAAVPVGTLLAVTVIPTRGDHAHLLRGAAWCVLLSSLAAAPLFALEVSGAWAFVAFAVSGTMYATSIPTNAVAGMRLQRDTRASAMGIAVGIIMGSQALGAAAGGIAAATVGTSTAITASFVLAAAFGAWAIVTSPRQAKHLRVGGPDVPAQRDLIDLRAAEQIDLSDTTAPEPAEPTTAPDRPSDRADRSPVPAV